MAFFTPPVKGPFFTPSTHWLSPKAGSGFIQGAKIGYNVGLKGNLPFAILGAGYSAATAPRGQAISKGLAAGTSFGLTSVVGGVVGGLLGGPIGAYAGSIIAPILFGDAIDKGIGGALQSAVDFGQNQRRMRFG